jgi:hypothetical protein
MVHRHSDGALASIWTATNVNDHDEESISFGSPYSNAGELSLVHGDLANNSEYSQNLHLRIEVLLLEFGNDPAGEFEAEAWPPTSATVMPGLFKLIYDHGYEEQGTLDGCRLLHALAAAPIPWQL